MSDLLICNLTIKISPPPPPPPQTLKEARQALQQPRPSTGSLIACSRASSLDQDIPTLQAQHRNGINVD